MQITQTRKELKHLEEYHDLYVQSDTLQLADVFDNFQDMCHEIYDLNPIRFLTAPGLTWQAVLKKTKVNVDILTDFDMLLMVEEGISGGISSAIHRYAKANEQIHERFS